MTNMNWTHLLWIDLETTGSNVKDHAILEVAFILTDAIGDNEMVRAEQVIGRQFMNNWTAEDWIAWYKPDDVVLKMHKDNGLWDDVTRSQISIQHADLALSNDLAKRGVKDKKVMIAGSGVGHFDRKFIDAYMPLTSSMLAYAAFDTGCIRRALVMSGFQFEADQHKTKSHRAMDDIELHLYEWRRYREILRVMVP